MRSMLLIVGKACALSVLMMSLSDHMSSIAGMPYIDPASFALCAVIALAMTFLVRPMRSSVVRVGFSVATLALMLVWCGLVVVFWGSNSFGPDVSDTMLVAYATVGRITTLFINAQWNVHISLSKVSESARVSSASIMLAMILFISSYFLEGLPALFLLVAVSVASCVLNIVMEVSVSSNDSSGYSYRNVKDLDEFAPVSDEAAKRTRILFFGSRILYGMMLGAVVGLSLHAQPVHVHEALIASICIVALVLGVVGSCFFFLDCRASSFVIAALPLASVLLMVTCFFSQDISEMTRVFVVMTEVVWITQNILQLPSYRKMTKSDPVSFAFVEYIFQIVPFYLVAWLFTSWGASYWPPFPAGEHLATVELFGLGCLVAVASIAIVRHIVRYHPAPRNDERSLGKEGSMTDALAITTTADRFGLTPREREVCDFLAMGYSRPYIAKMLYISPDTAKTHTKHIYAKMGVDSQDALIGLIRSSESKGDVAGR